MFTFIWTVLFLYGNLCQVSVNKRLIGIDMIGLQIKVVLYPYSVSTTNLHTFLLLSDQNVQYTMLCKHTIFIAKCVHFFHVLQWRIIKQTAWWFFHQDKWTKFYQRHNKVTKWAKIISNNIYFEPFGIERFY